MSTVKTLNPINYFKGQYHEPKIIFITCFVLNVCHPSERCGPVFIVTRLVDPAISCSVSQRVLAYAEWPVFND